MIVYIGLIIWIVLINSIIRPVIVDNGIGGITQKAKNLQVFLTMGMIVFVLGMNSGIADTYSYIRSFNEISFGIDNLFDISIYANQKGPIFYAFAIVCKSIVPNYHFFFLVVAGLSGFLVAKTLQKYSEYYSDSIVLFMLTATFTWMINGVRQFLAVAILFYFSKLIEKKRIIPYIIVLLIAYGIHNSSIILLPAFFIVFGKAWNKRTILLIVALIIALLLFSNQFTSILMDVADDYADSLATGHGSNPLRTIIYGIPTVLAFIRRKKIEECAPPYINICINMSILCVATSLIANFTSGTLVGRVPIYFSLFNLILLPWLIEKVYSENRTVFKIIMYVAYSLYFLIEGNVAYHSDALFGGAYIQPLQLFG